MLRKIYPYTYVKSVFRIDYDKLFEMGYRGLIFDIDATLVPHGRSETEEVVQLFETIHRIGFQTCLLSNNDAARVDGFATAVKSPYVCDAEKPAASGFQKAASLMQLPAEKVVVIGDQLFTDIRGANRCKMASIFVDFIPQPGETKLGRRRTVEKYMMKVYILGGERFQRLPNLQKKEEDETVKERRLFCDFHPVCYEISLRKEILKRHIKNLLERQRFARTRSEELLPVVISTHSNKLIKKGKGVDPTLQLNKAVNINLANRSLDGLLIRPGETFSFWDLVGNPTRRKGYKDGRVIVKGKLQPGIGGGLCNLGNTIHLLVLHSPLTVTEFHTHSDALAPDHGVRVPLSAGTSVYYNMLDFRFKNNTKKTFQLHLWCDEENLYGELRCTNALKYDYRIVEEGHHFAKENGKYYCELLG